MKNIFQECEKNNHNGQAAKWEGANKFISAVGSNKLESKVDNLFEAQTLPKQSEKTISFGLLRAGMHSIRPAEAFNLAREIPNFFNFASFVDKNDLRIC